MNEQVVLTSAPSFRWFMLLLNILAYGQFFLTVQIPTVFSSYITADLGVSPMMVSLCGTIILGVFALTGGLGAKLVAKFGLKKSICIAIIVNIIGQHANAWFAVGMVIFGEMGVDVDGIKVDTFTFQRLEYEVVYWPESVFGKGCRSQSILVAHHHQFEIQVLGNKGEVCDGSFSKT